MLNSSNDDCSDISYISADGAVAVIASKDLRGNENVRMRALTDSKEAIGRVYAGKIKSLQPILKGVTLYLSTFDRKIDNNTSQSPSQDEYLNGKRYAESWLALSLSLYSGADRIPSNCFSVAQAIVQYLTGIIEIRPTKHINQIDDLSIDQIADIALPEDDIVPKIKNLHDSSAIVSGL